MARGWESKGIEEQIANAESDRNFDRDTAASGTRLKQQALRLETLRLSKVHLLQQLENAKHEAHRSMLNSALKSIERDIDELSAS